MADFHYNLDSDGIATITWNISHKSINILTFESADQLHKIIDKILTDRHVKGAVITSSKPDFAAGMDLNILKKMATMDSDKPARGVYNKIMKLHRLIRKIERAGMNDKNEGGKPIVAALPGTAVGIGYEIPLACHRIFVADNPKAKIGLPEILVGIFPGAGGTTRMLRKMGLRSTLQILLQGRLYNPQKALELQMIDEVIAPNQLIIRAKNWILNATNADIVKPWDIKGFKMPGGTPYHPTGFVNYVGAIAMVHGKTFAAYPAAKAMLSAIYEGAQVDFDTALKIEARWFTYILLHPSSQAMINSLFTSKKALEKGASRMPNIKNIRVKKLGVLGAGMMGTEIACVAARAGINVVLVDKNQTIVEHGHIKIEALLNKEIKHDKITLKEKNKTLDRILPTSYYADLNGCDLVIEAVFENLSIKADVTRAAEANLPDNAIFATNTSTLPITELAKASRDDSHYIGIHFFSPVYKMKLIEIIRGTNTGDEAIARALDFAQQIKKTPIVVNDARFFYANRCILPYVKEGISMIAEGVAPALIENAARLLGMPIGPLQLTDEISIDLSVKIIKLTQSALGSAYQANAADAILFKLAAQNRMGRKAKAGFYHYNPRGQRLGLWQGLSDLWPIKPNIFSLTVIKNRLTMIQTLEAVRALESGVLMDVREGDVAAILGWGYMPWSGGPFSWLDMIGAKKAVAICDQLVDNFGGRFMPPPLLRNIATQDDSFYHRFYNK